MRELLALAEREQELRAKVDEVGRDARRASEELAEAREALIELERHAGVGEKSSAQERKAAETRLAKAQQEAGAPWAERLAGAERGAADARHAIQRHAAERLAELVAEVEEAGADAAQQVDAAAQSFLDAVGRVTAIEHDVTAIMAATGRHMRPGDITRLRSDQAANVMRTFLAEGGERGPTLRRDLPELGQVADEQTVGAPA